MRTLITVVAFLSIFMSVRSLLLTKTIRREWELYKTTYNKSYESEEEEVKRLDIYLNNRNFINKHNELYAEGKVTYYLAINKFADWTTTEITNTLLKCNTSVDFKEGFDTEDDYDDDDDDDDELLSNSPDAVDWVSKGAVTSVKDQGQCGSCYAFSAVGALEGQYFITTGKLVNLSVQNIVDCSRTNFGCNGGWPENVFKYVKQSSGIDTWKEYPYRARQGICRFDPQKAIADCSGYKFGKEGCEKCLRKMVKERGPVSVSIDSSLPEFQFYSGGVFQNPRCSSILLNHAVLIVGYGIDDFRKEKYWLLKNSWGTYWGLNGYMKLARNKNNMCGVASAPIIPVM